MRLNRLKTAASLLVACLPCVALANSEPSDTQYPYFTKQFPERPASFSALGERMREDGVFYRGLALASVFNNASTGVDTGQVGGQAIFINALDLDMGKIAALADTFVHMEGVVFPWHYPRDDSVEFGTFASSYLGGDQYPSHAPGLDPWLSLLTVEKVMFDGALDLEAGKTNLQRYFFTPNCGVDFLCTDSLVKWNTGVPDASTGSLAARMRWNLNPRWAVEVGAQQMREYSSLINHRGWDAFGAGGGTGRFYVGGTVSFFVFGPVMACRQAGPDFHQVGLMNRSPYRIAN